MQSQGSTFSQAPFDSLSSSGSLALSDSEPAEDDGEVFLTDGFPPAGATHGGGGVVGAEGSGGSESPGSQWACDGFAGKEEEEGYCERSAVVGGRVGDYATDTASQSSVSQGDVLFAQKCAELQGFVRPLLELLNGLKRGRFQRGLSSFQQNVAMDRIQRIVGILQRPNCGEKYLNTLLQVEMMLKMWFPQISAHSTTPSTAPPPRNLPSATPPHKHRDQLHIPVKKRRLSWTGTDSPAPSPVLPKHPEQDRRAARGQAEGEVPPPQGQDNTSNEEGGQSSSHPAGQRSEPSLTWVHVAPILSLPKAPHAGTVAARADESVVVAVAPPTISGSLATQDSSVSSTTPRKQPKNQKRPPPCQSQPVANQQTESKTLGSCPWQNQAPPVTVKPLSRLCPAPSET